jgi:hypothetical protein
MAEPAYMIADTASADLSDAQRHHAEYDRAAALAVKSPAA